MSEPTSEVQNSGVPTPEQLGFDPAELRKKYAQERARRLRSEGNDQYREVVGQLARFEEDPYVAPFARPPIREDIEALIVGGGFGGLLAAARLQQAGIT